MNPENIIFSYTIYTDGGIWGNGMSINTGAWAYYIEELDLLIGKEELNTTNNRVEILAAIQGLSYLSNNNIIKDNIVIVSDSQYLVNAINSWIYSWQKTNYRKNKIKNRDLWDILLVEIQKQNIVAAKWVKGHANNKLNALVDDKCGEIIKNYVNKNSF